MRILLDAMCGGLRPYLRMCGHDAAYCLERGVEDDDGLLELARREDRTLVTRDRDLAARGEKSVLLTERETVPCLCELHAAGVDLSLAATPTRCGRCNGPLAALPEGADRPEYVPDGQGRVWTCEDCGQFFWKGSHWEDVRETLARVRSGGH